MCHEIDGTERRVPGAASVKIFGACCPQQERAFERVGLSQALPYRLFAYKHWSTSTPGEYVLGWVAVELSVLETSSVPVISWI